MRVLVCLFLMVALIAAVQPVATDGEATVYLMGDFTGAFDVAYTAKLQPAPQNNSWSTLGIMLIGLVNPRTSIEIGVAYRSGTSPIEAFTSVHDLTGEGAYKTVDASCADGCTIELLGDAADITALINGAIVGNWPRASLPMNSPYIQLNGEVHGPGDTISASLLATKTTAAGSGLSSPTCGFTTRGIVPKDSKGTLLLSGATNEEAESYLNLRTGAVVTRCADTTLST
jgi:hypothetical protein